ncbi:MAG TPA: twin-arginine translocase subunit TatC [Chitinophagaceae bacterium]|nr:twin-arginine translocase subunit TatC [Chitinophagaceae bacterium]
MALNSFLQRRAPRDADMSFVDHLEALRWHIFRMVLYIAIAGVVIFIKIDWIFDKIIRGPIRKDFISYTGLCRFGQWIGAGDALCMPTVDTDLQSTAFGSMFMTSINIAIFGGIIVAAPFICWELWKFVKPALTSKEVKNTRGAVAFVSVFFFLGIAFGYFLLAPFTFSFLSNYKLGTSTMMVVKPTLDDYIENLVDIIIGCGLAFELPVAAFVLTKIGLITPSFLRTYRKYAIVIILIVAAVITPSPDWMSQTIVTIPLWLLYEFSIFVSARVQKEEEREWS